MAGVTGRDTVADRLEAALGSRPARLSPLAGASTGAVYRADLGDGRAVAVKHGQANLAIEARMLADLAAESGLPVPSVLYADPDLMVMEFIPHDGTGAPGAAQAHAAVLLSALHAVPRPFFGYGYDTVIGVLPQPNPKADRWVPFFRDHRLLAMAGAGLAEGTVTSVLHRRLEALAARLDSYLDEPRHPALLHGDLWTGNVLYRGDRVVGMIDPALTHGHPEIELAFATLFGTLGERFFKAYAERAPFDWDFFDLRRDLYTLYPLLVHVRAWSAGYARGIEAVLDRLGL